MERRPKTRKMEKLEHPLFTELTPRESERVAGGAEVVEYTAGYYEVDGKVVPSLDSRLNISF